VRSSGLPSELADVGNADAAAVHPLASVHGIVGLSDPAGVSFIGERS
jgi:hypothetical protein